MPSGNTAFIHFGILTAVLSSFFTCSENKALAKDLDAKAPYIVVIDAGHGGGDLGTSVKVGKKRVSEKELCLAIALRTRKVLQDEEYWKPLGRPVKVILTRERDRDISLEHRAEIARNAKADLFVSIHANSDPTKTAHGLETYFLNNTDDSSSSKLVQIENKTSKKYAKSAPAASLLIRSVAADAVVETSRQAAESLQNSLVAHLRSNDIDVVDRGVRQGMFYVLLDAQVPAVLIESFFLSNPQDRELVEQPENRQKIAEGIAKGVLRFLALQ